VNVWPLDVENTWVGWSVTPVQGQPLFWDDYKNLCVNIEIFPTQPVRVSILVRKKYTYLPENNRPPVGERVIWGENMTREIKKREAM
jgi:hypothetical protein